jgi:hypothetical protein
LNRIPESASRSSESLIITTLTTLLIAQGIEYSRQANLQENIVLGV